MNDSNLTEFINAVNSEVDSRIELINEQAEVKRKEMLESAENEALNDAYSRIKSCVSEEKYKSRMTVSKAEQEARIKVLTHRESLVGKIFTSVNDRLNDFTKSKAYDAFLSGLISGEKTDENTTVFLREEDMKYEEMLRAIAGTACTFAADSSIVYGGLSIYDRVSSVLVNKTIDNMLEEQKKDFGSNYRLA